MPSQSWLICRCSARLAMLIVAACAIGLGGCAGYVLKGKVVQGYSTSAMWATENDNRIHAQGVPDVRLVLYRDPDSLGRTRIGEGRSDQNGRFQIVVDSFLAGTLIEQWQLEIYRRGFQTGSRTFSMPADGDEMIVTVVPGDATPLTSDNALLEESLRYRSTVDGVSR